MTTLYEAVGGYERLARLAAAWHERVMADDVVSHAFSHGFHRDHTARLAAYWSEALGGPATYSERMGTESDVVRLHSGKGHHAEMDERAIDCFDHALSDVGLDRDQTLARQLHDYFVWSIRAMARFEQSDRHVPEGLAIAHWSFDGLVSDAK